MVTDRVQGFNTPLPEERAANRPRWLPVIPDAILRELTDARVSLLTHRHARQPSNPCLIFSSGNLRPMKTRRLSRFSSDFQGR